MDEATSGYIKPLFSRLKWYFRIKMLELKLKMDKRAVVCHKIEFRGKKLT